MAVGVILEFQGVDKATYDAVNDKLGINPNTGDGDWPEGIVSHAGGTTSDGGLIVIEVWEAKENQEQFMQSRLGPALGEVGVPEPVRVTWIDIIGYEAR
jgi:hypothetical protein